MHLLCSTYIEKKSKAVVVISQGRAQTLFLLLEILKKALFSSVLEIEACFRRDMKFSVQINSAR